MQGKNSCERVKGKDVVYTKEASEDGLGSRLGKERRVAQFLDGLEQTINSIPFSPEPNPFVPIVLEEEKKLGAYFKTTQKLKEENVVVPTLVL